MPSQLFEQHITDLNFSLLDKAQKTSGVLLTDSFEQVNPESTPPDILFALETAKSKFQADAVFFRYFQDGRGFVPQLYLFDYTNKNLTNEERNRIHIQMWNGYQVPAYIIIEKSSVSIFDSRKRPKEDKDSYAKEILTWTGKAIKDFNAKEFDNGIFWDEQNEKNFRFEESATKDLIRGLKGIFTSFIDELKLDRHVALKLLVQSLLIKYLEERDEKSASGYFAGTYFKKNFQCSNFCDTIRSGKLLDLLDQLAKDFNGKIFQWDKETEIEERNAIQQAKVQNLANYLDGDNKDSQYVIWRLYSFTHLPVEVISSVYEELLTDSKDIVYTPEMIVSTLVDECMPLKTPQKDFKIIDVSCGSGIFLVKTYKRIVQWWRYEEWKKTGKLIKPSLKVLKELLLKSIHGVDVEPDAIRLSVFSLALAILDEVDLDPPTWGKLKFPDLSENIITQDFFEFIMIKPNPNWDLVIGNPPFNLPEVNGKEPSRKQHFKELKERVSYESEISIPDENPALHFLVQSLKLLKQDGLLCLIEPSGPLLYQKDLSFKQNLFSQNNLLQVIDFTKLADKLWGRKNVATAAVFVQKSTPDAESVLHLVANRTFTNNNRLFLEFDHYDFHVVTKDELINSPYVWKANLMGGGRLSQLIERLSEIPTIGHYLKGKKRSNGWVYGDGFIKGKPDDELIDSDFEKKKGGYTEAQHLTDKLCFEPEDFDENGIHKTFVNHDKYYQWPRVETIFKSPLLLIKKNIGKESIPVVFCNEPITYKNEIIGIHAPNEDVDSLKVLEDTLRNNKVFRFYLALTSSQAGVSRSKSTLLQKDIFNLPFLGHLNVSEVDQLIIDDIIDYQLSNSILSDNSTETNISTFSEIFCKTLNSVYQSTRAFKLFKIIDSGKYFALHFEYTSEEITVRTESAASLEKYIESVIPSKNGKSENDHIQKIIKVYGQDSIILAKPKQLRYWLPSIALRDADETFADYFKSRHTNA